VTTFDEVLYGTEMKARRPPQHARIQVACHGRVMFMKDSMNYAAAAQCYSLQI
jgi:hypothetical protein